MPRRGQGAGDGGSGGGGGNECNVEHCHLGINQIKTTCAESCVLGVLRLGSFVSYELHVIERVKHLIDGTLIQYKTK